MSVSERMAKTPEGNVYTVDVDDAQRVKRLVEKIKELKDEVEFWKKLSRVNSTYYGHKRPK